MPGKVNHQGQDHGKGKVVSGNTFQGSVSKVHFEILGIRGFCFLNPHLSCITDNQDIRRFRDPIAMAAYKYTPLRPGQIRLLHLQIDKAETEHRRLTRLCRTDGNTPTQPTSRLTAIQSPSADHSFTSCAMCAGPHNSPARTRRRRAPSGPTVCASTQDNLAEKNTQIPPMDRIYRKASRVITYIGEADDTTPSALALARDLLALARATQAPDPAKADELYAQQNRLLGIPDHILFDGPHPDERVRAPASHALCPLEPAPLDRARVAAQRQRHGRDVRGARDGVDVTVPSQYCTPAPAHSAPAAP